MAVDIGQLASGLGGLMGVFLGWQVFFLIRQMFITTTFSTLGLVGVFFKNRQMFIIHFRHLGWQVSLSRSYIFCRTRESITIIYQVFAVIKGSFSEYLFGRALSCPETPQQVALFTRSLLSVLEKVCLGAERMVLRMWTQKLVNPLVNVGDVAPS